MKPVHQTIFGDGSGGGERGNCFAACIASILGLPLDDVPNFCNHENWREEANQWLKQFGLFYVDFAIPEDQRAELIWEHAGYHVIIGPAQRGLRHSVVGYKGQGVHDPHPSGAMLLEAQEYGFLVSTFELAMPMPVAESLLPRNAMSLRELVIAKRQRDKLSLRDVAEATGVSPSTLSRVENNPNLSVDLETAAKLAYWLGVGFEVFVRPHVAAESAGFRKDEDVASLLAARLRADDSINPAMVDGLVNFFQAAYDAARMVKAGNVEKTK